MYRAFHTCLFASCAIVWLVVSGCGPSGPTLYPVKGKVTVNGKEASNAIVFLHRKGKTDIGEPTPYGKAAEDGTFSISTMPGQDGAQLGDYVVTVVWPDMSKPEDGNGGRPDALHGLYDKVANSKLTATVKAESNALSPFELTISAAQAARPDIKDPNNK